MAGRAAIRHREATYHASIKPGASRTLKKFLTEEKIMRITCSSKIQNLILATALIIGLGFVSPVFAQPRSYILDTNGQGWTELGTLGGHYSYARGINDAGQVVGESGTTVVEGPPSHAFITGPDGVGMTDLGTLGGDYSYAWGINDAGQVVGKAATAAGYPFHAFITGPNGVGMTDLGTLGGDYSAATGINDAGQVIGTSGTAAGEEHAFITGPNGTGMRDLGTLGTTNGTSSRLVGISDAGQVAGWSITDAGWRAFITGPDGVGRTDLGTLGGDYSVATGINDAGQVIGIFHTVAGEQHAFITGPDGVGMTDLHSLVELPAGFILYSVDDINNEGQVIVTGTIPEPQSYALMLAGLILLGFVTRRKNLPA